MSERGQTPVVTRHSSDAVLRALRTGIAALTIAAVATAIVITCGYWLGPERFWFFSLIQYAPYPVFVLPFIGLIAVSWIAGRRWFLLATAGLVMVLTVVMGLEVHRGGSAAGSGRIRVLTFNVKDYITLRTKDGSMEIIDEIARHDPDIFMLQDARMFEPERIDSTFARLVFGDRQRYVFGQYVIASRFPLRECRNGWISFRDEPHTYVACVATIGGTDVDLVTTHFMTPRFGLEAARFHPIVGIRDWMLNVSDRMTQARLLADDVRKMTRPVILAGDLNAPESSLVVRTLLNAGLRDAFSVAGFGYGHTWGHSLRFRLSFLRIDHILVSDEFRVLRSFNGEPAGSAHRPVIADLYLDRPRP